MRERTIEHGKFRMEALSEYRSEIYGISIFWVMLFHMKESHYFPTIKGSSLYHAWMGFVGMGNMGVDIFLFLSGICLYFSFTKNPDFYAFIKKRIARIAYPVCFTSMLLWLQYLMMHRISIWGFVNRVFLLQYWIDSDRQVWYVSLLLILYFVYPYIYRFFFEKNNIISSVCRTTGLILIIVIITAGIHFEYPRLYQAIDLALPRVPVFLTGCICGKFVYEKRHIPFMIPLVTIVLFVASYVVTNKMHMYHGLLQRYIYWCGGVAAAFFLVIVLSYTPKCFRSICCKWGAISLEIYLAHIVIRRELGTQFAKTYLRLPWWGNVLIIFGGAYIWAKFVAWCVTKVQALKLKSSL